MVKGKKKIYILLAVVMVLTVIAEVLFAHPHYHMLWNEIPGFDILIGFAGAWFLIVLAKIVMSKLLQRKEGYYDSEEAQSSGCNVAQEPKLEEAQGLGCNVAQEPKLAETQGSGCDTVHGQEKGGTANA